jgi:hypothetical protein
MNYFSLSGNFGQLPTLIIADRLLDFGARVDDERSVLHDRLAQRPRREHQERIDAQVVRAAEAAAKLDAGAVGGRDRIDDLLNFSVGHERIHPASREEASNEILVYRRRQR